MRKIASYNLAQLLMQLRFTPEKKRRKQLDAAEQLFAIIDPDKEYPFEFVFFRITGFNLKSPDGGELIKGDQLLEDLRIFISKLGGKLARPIAEQTETIYTVAELADRIGVSTKTIYRWRKRGLIPRKYIFPDGIRRLGFLQSKVDDFIKVKPGLVGKAKGFDRLTDKQKQQIVKQAARLSADENLSRHQIIAKISAKTGRAPETIRYTLLNYENANPDKTTIKKSGGVIEPAQAAEIYRLYKQGCTVKELMNRFDRNKSSIYRIINQRRAKSLRAKKIEFVASDEFLKDGAEQQILSESVASFEPSVARDIEPTRLTGSSLTEYLSTIKDLPVLNRQREVELFRQYNYLKFLACRIRTDLKGTNVSGTKLRQVEGYLSRAEEIKRRIIEANLRLVVGVARRHTTDSTHLLDLVGEGNVSLMRAVEKFDYTRGFRFATFASWIIAKDFARKIPEHRGRLGKAATASLEKAQQDLRSEDAVDFEAMERAHLSLTQVIEDNLTERERHIIINRFGLVGTPIRKHTKTLKQIGEELGLSKERVRQIELTALQKLRQSLSIEEFELLTG
ncbi:MAG: sigma-70 family RNA polymerase sigma factor [Phycisphaerales bacterium]|nr:MAG: sigma-70 family RNA polymerase sigma factor [Phycisphaerales bacterium]